MVMIITLETRRILERSKANSMNNPLPIRIRRFSTVILAVLLAVCDSNAGPQTTGTISDRTLAIGGDVRVDLASFFTDPDGDKLTFTATSSAPSVVTTTVSGSLVTISPVAVGTATVTATATDPEGLSATLDFAATVENRPPEATGTIPSQTMGVGRGLIFDLTYFFTDPDGGKLTFTATSSAPSVVTTTVSDSVATINAVALGTATVTATATDAQGSSATLDFSVTVAERVKFRDDFDRFDKDLWALSDVDATVSDSILNLEPTVPDEYDGTATHEPNSVLTDWEASVRMSRQKADEAYAALFFTTTDSRYTHLLFVIWDRELSGEKANYTLLYWDEVQETFYYTAESFGYSPDVHHALGEFTEITVSEFYGNLTAYAGKTKLLEVDWGSDIKAFGLLAGGGGTSAFDWVEVTGVPVTAAPVAGPSAVNGKGMDKITGVPFPVPLLVPVRK